MKETFVVYHYRRDLDESRICNLGCKHSVTFHERKVIRLAGEGTTFIKALHYTHDGYGKFQIAVDAQGRTYERKESWSGWQGWVRADGKVFFDRPVLVKDAAFTLNGKRI